MQRKCYNFWDWPPTTVDTYKFHKRVAPKFQWSEECQQAFSTLITRLSSDPILKCFDFSQPFTLYTDASDTGLGAVLQHGDSVIAYLSRTLKAAEKHYSVIEKRMFGTCMQFTNSSIISWDDHLLFIQTIILSSGSQLRK